MTKSIAIDGPAGAGKSTIAKLVGKRIGANYLDTGAMYRAVGLYMLRCGIDLEDAAQIAAHAAEARVTVKYSNGKQLTFLNGEDVSGVIREPEVSRTASKVAAVREVRRPLAEYQQQLALSEFMILDGRDIGTAVIPDSPLKIYLTATAEERARRRFDEMSDKSCGYAQVLEDINRRDYNDMHRAESPLTKAEDAVEIDSTDMTPEQVANKIAELYENGLCKA